MAKFDLLYYQEVIKSYKTINNMLVHYITRLKKRLKVKHDTKEKEQDLQKLQ